MFRLQAESDYPKIYYIIFNGANVPCLFDTVLEILSDFFDYLTVPDSLVPKPQVHLYLTRAGRSDSI